MTFKRLSYYLYDAQVITKCNPALLRNFLTVYTINSKVNNWRTEIVGNTHVSFEHMKGRANTLASHILRLNIMRLHDFLSPEEHGKESHL